MHDWSSLSHVRWECKYHVVIVPKYRKKVFYGKKRKRIGDILRELCKQRGVDLVEGHAMADHIHLCLSIPPKYSVSHTIGLDEEQIRNYIRGQEELERRKGDINQTEFEFE